ncbi:hypothetical protein GCM10020221_01150 [Streptomyces thioluteus]|uniref:Uncharacterized protein n=1 Tax=Streptomyces thioluteus TaxID=66431 RepID=A0ABP6ITH0_STRTU
MPEGRLGAGDLPRETEKGRGGATPTPDTPPGTTPSQRSRHSPVSAPPPTHKQPIPPYYRVIQRTPAHVPLTGGIRTRCAPSRESARAGRRHGVTGIAGEAARAGGFRASMRKEAS